MKKLTIAAAIAAVAIAITLPFALGQTTPNSDTAPPAASSPDKQGQGAYGPGMMGGNAQTQDQGPNRGGYGPGMMSGNAQGQNQGLMGGSYGFGWMGGYGGIWVPILLVILVAGVVAWVVSQKKK
ncbi:MAG: hypothetical protein WBO23_12310 [Burkholderiales bacterium]